MPERRQVPGDASPARIFLSYRRDDSAGFAGRLADTLEAEFGAGSVFRDVDDIAPGQDFAVAITSQLAVVALVLVMIGPRWLASGADGKRRLDAADDFVRLEVASALAAGKTVIPLLVGGARMPAEGDLPPSLAALARRQAVVLSDDRWRGDVAQLVAKLRPRLARHDPAPTAAPRRWLYLTAAGALLLAIFAALRLAPDTSTAVPTVQPVVAQPTVEVNGRWTARVKYDWGDEHDEVFEFRSLGKALHGTASYLGGRLAIEQAKLEGEWLSFVIRSQEMLGSDTPWKEVTHRYTGQVTPMGIRFTLESGGGYTLHPPVEFLARRAPAGGMTARERR